MAKPAARLSDPTSCPIPGHGTNPIAVGSPNVLFDGLPAARESDPSACGSPLVSGLSSTVIINGLHAATVNSGGTHGNTVIAGSGTVLIGDSHSAAPFQAPVPLQFAKTFAQAFAITDSETSQPLASRDFVATVDGKKVFGVTDASGLAHVEAPSESSVISIHVLFRSPARALGEFKEGAQ
jgi:uncharacterized Zn-binding protein involved in type VI secretion